MNMNAVGLDVSKRKSTVAILRPGGINVKINMPKNSHINMYNLSC